ncbi:KAR5, partial [Candida africana]
MVIAQDLQLFGDFKFELSDNWRNDCAKKALEPIINQCAEGIETISPFQQKLIAIQLSICEFENAEISYPSECRSQNLDTCILLLEKSPQYWTTFSGYYREIRNICHQVSLPFAKDQILQVYENITEFYRTLMDEMTSSNKYTENMQIELKAKFDKLISVIDLILADREKNRENLKSSFNMFKNNFEKSLNNALVVMKHSYEDANSNIKELGSHLNYFINDMLQVYILINEKSLEVLSQQDEIKGNYDGILVQIEKIRNKVAEMHEGTMDVQVSNKQWAQDMQTNLDYSLFMVSKLDSHLQLSINDFIEKNEDIRSRASIMFEEIFELFLSHLNDTGRIAMDSFKAKLNLSLNRLQEKMNQTEESIDSLNSKVRTLFNFAESTKEYASSIFKWPNHVNTLVNSKIKQLRAFGNSLVMIGVLFLGALCLLTFILLRAPIMKILRFAFIGIPMITGVTLALFILKIMSTPLEVIDID